MMKIVDKIYGEVEITEPVLEELINSSALQRLKGIAQGGYYPAYPRSQQKELTRFYHSVGDMLLLRRFNAPLEEQIAGLIHDVSHTSFSHTYDYIMNEADGQKKQDFQDSIHERFVLKSDIPQILEKYGYDLNYILDDSHFTLKENNTPNICSDRIDYSLRDDYFQVNLLGKEEREYILNSLMVFDGSFVMKNFESAKFFAEFFWKLDEMQYSSLQSAVMFGIGGLLFKSAIDAKLITLNDFFDKNDAEILKIIEDNLNKNESVKKYYDYLHLPTEEFESNPKNYIRQIFCKVRRIDPQFVDDGKLSRVSDYDMKFKERLDKRSKFNEYFLNKKS
ncbi:MAG: hypothetical protein PHY80_03125 [Rickettsiales bacterium]|nr:hypothetical protein [Rickettsiales bacterium]